MFFVQTIVLDMPPNEETNLEQQLMQKQPMGSSSKCLPRITSKNYLE